MRDCFLTRKGPRTESTFWYQMLLSWKRGKPQVVEKLVDLVGIEPTTFRHAGTRSRSYLEPESVPESNDVTSSS